MDQNYKLMVKSLNLVEVKLSYTSYLHINDFLNVTLIWKLLNEYFSFKTKLSIIYNMCLLSSYLILGRIRRPYIKG